MRRFGVYFAKTAWICGLLYEKLYNQRVLIYGIALKLLGSVLNRFWAKRATINRHNPVVSSSVCAKLPSTMSWSTWRRLLPENKNCGPMFWGPIAETVKCEMPTFAQELEKLLVYPRSIPTILRKSRTFLQVLEAKNRESFHELLSYGNKRKKAFHYEKKLPYNGRVLPHPQ